MNHLFVPYQESLELKDLGFDEPCLATYEFKKLFIGEFKNSMSFELCKKTEVFPAPTWDQAFDWFRKKHGLICEITYEIENFYFNIKSISNKYDNYEILLSLRNRNEWEFKSYEDAQIACLQNMIEKVKSNS